MSGSFYIGDSRMASIGVNQGLTPKSGVTDNGGTNDVVGQGEDGNYYYAAGGKDYSWFAANVQQIVQQAKQQDCDYVVINMGVNDWPNFLQKTAQGGGVDEAGARRMAEKYRKLAQQIESQSGKKVVFVTPYPLSGNYERNKYNAAWDNSRDAINAGLAEFNSCLSIEASEHGFGFIDIFTPINKPEYLNNDSYWADGVHGSPKLNEVVSKLINQGLEGLQAQSQNRTTESDSNESRTGQGSLETNDNADAGSSAPEVMYSFQNGHIVQTGVSSKAAEVTNTLTDKQKSNMSRWAERVGLSKDVVQQLIEKYGDNAYKLMLKAMMEPHSLVGYIGEAPRSSRRTIELLLELDTKEAQTLLSSYSLTGGVNTVAPTSTAKAQGGSPSQGNSTRSSDNPPIQPTSRGNAAGPTTGSSSSVAVDDYLKVIDLMPEYLVQFEGMRLKAYWDVTSPSIGLGTKQYWQSNVLPPRGRQIKTRRDQTCRREDAVLWCKQNLAHMYERIKEAGLHVEKMTANQLIGILSFAYNFGYGYLTSSAYGGPARVQAINAYLDDPDDVEKRDKVRQAMRATGRGASNKRRQFEAAMVLGDVACADFGSVRQGCLKSISYTYQGGHYIGVDTNIERYNSTHTRSGTAYAQVWGSEPTRSYAFADRNRNRA